jgi:hypothetical protein
VCPLINVHKPPAEDNFCDEHRRAHKPVIVKDYRQCMGYFDTGNKMANSYSISWTAQKRAIKLFFHLMHVTMLNSYINLTSCGCETDYQKCCLNLVKNLLKMSGWRP